MLNFEKIIRRDGAIGLGDDALGGLAGEPGALFPADLRHGARRDANAPREILPLDAMQGEPLHEFHGLDVERSLV